MRVARLFLFADWPEKYFSGLSEGGISNASGTRSVRVSAQGLSRSCCKLSPMKIPSSRLAAPGSPRMIVYETCSQFSIRPPWPRNKSAEVNVSLKDILVVLGELSSFLSLLRMASSLTQAVSHSEQRSTATVKYVSRFIASCLQIFI